MYLQKDNILNSDETLEDLQTGGLVLLQKKDGFRFGIDAVLLADFAKNIKSADILDLCTGNGIIPVLLSHKSSAEKLFGIEIQPEVSEMAVRSVKLNRLEDKVFLTCGDLKNAVDIYGKRRFGLITCNPPYMPAGSAVKNELSSKTIARHEILCTLDDIITVSSLLLKHQGHLIIVHKPGRLADIICLMRQRDIEPKRIRFIHKLPDSEPNLVLVDGAYKGGPELRIMPPLYLYNSDGSETEELKRIYER